MSDKELSCWPVFYSDFLFLFSFIVDNPSHWPRLSTGPDFALSSYQSTRRRAWNAKPIKPFSTIRKTCCAVSIFHQWLREHSSDSRAVEEIPPRELNDYLVTFLTTIKKKNGSPYFAKSLKCVRDSIDRHLKDQNYPCSITTSLEFSTSQVAYRKQYHYLRQLQQGLGKSKPA